MDRAYTDPKPISPNEVINFGLAVLLSLLTPTVFILGREYFNTKIVERRDLESVTDIPVIGTISHNQHDNQLVVKSHPKASISEAFRAIRSNLSFTLPREDEEESNSRVILITSSIGGEGKTFCSMNLSIALSIMGKKTILMGVDLRKPRIYNDFNLSNTVGLSNYLANLNSVDEVIQPTDIENLSILSAGPIPPNPSELILTMRTPRNFEPGSRVRTKWRQRDAADW